SIVTMGVTGDEISFRRFVDLRYGAQVHVLSVPTPRGLDDAAMEQVLADFDALYEARNGPGTGYRDAGVEMTAIRVEVVGRAGRVPLAPTSSNGAGGTLDLAGAPTRTVHWGHPVGSLETPIVHADHLAAGQSLQGPAVIELPTTTVPVRPGDALRVDPLGN